MVSACSVVSTSLSACNRLGFGVVSVLSVLRRGILGGIRFVRVVFAVVSFRLSPDCSFFSVCSVSGLSGFGSFPFGYVGSLYDYSGVFVSFSCSVFEGVVYDLFSFEGFHFCHHGGFCWSLFTWISSLLSVSIRNLIESARVMLV